MESGRGELGVGVLVMKWEALKKFDNSMVNGRGERSGRWGKASGHSRSTRGFVEGERRKRGPTDAGGEKRKGLPNLTPQRHHQGRGGQTFSFPVADSYFSPEEVEKIESWRDTSCQVTKL